MGTGAAEAQPPRELQRLMVLRGGEPPGKLWVAVGLPGGIVLGHDDMMFT